MARTDSSTGVLPSIRCKSQMSGAEPKFSIDWSIQCLANSGEPEKEARARSLSVTAH